MKTSELQKHVCNWAEAATPADVMVVKANKPSDKGVDEHDEVAAPMAPKPFIAIGLGGFNSVGSDDDHSMGGTDGEDMEYVGHRERTLSFNIFGSNEDPEIYAGDILGDLKFGIESDVLYRDHLEPHEIAPLEVTGAVEQNAVGGKGWENRAQIDIRFRYADARSEKPGVVEKVGVKGDRGGDTETQNIDMDYA